MAALEKVEIVVEEFEEVQLAPLWAMREVELAA